MRLADVDSALEAASRDLHLISEYHVSLSWCPSLVMSFLLYRLKNAEVF